MLTPSKWLCTWPPIVSGGSTPSTSRIVGTRSIGVVVLLADLAAASMPAGQEMMHGSDVPPLNS